MRILVFSLFLYFNFFTSNAQENVKEKELVKIEACYPACKMKLSKKKLMKAEVFVGDVNVKVTKFNVKIMGFSGFFVNGNKMNDYCLEKMKNLKVGDFVQFFNVRSTYKTLKRPALLVEIIE